MSQAEALDVNRANDHLDFEPALPGHHALTNPISFPMVMDFGFVDSSRSSDL